MSVPAATKFQRMQDEIAALRAKVDELEAGCAKYWSGMSGPERAAARSRATQLGLPDPSVRHGA